MATDPKVIAVAQAIKQSIETSSSPGLSVNAHPNAFFLNVVGAVDLYRAAEHALARIAQYEEGVRLRFEDDVKQLGLRLLAEAKAGAVSVEDALARIKSKAGGELALADGVLQEAITKVKDIFVPAKNA